MQTSREPGIVVPCGLCGHFAALLGLVALLAPMGGCIEFGEGLFGPAPNPDGPPRFGDDFITPGGNDQPATDAPRVRLDVSNPSPALDETVELRCMVVDADSDGVTFAFQPDDGRLLADAQAGVASFIVDASDISIGISYTCTGTNEFGTSAASDPVLILPAQGAPPVVEP